MSSGPRELGLGLQTDKGPGRYAALAQAAEEAGFAVVTTFNDLWFQPALPALLEIARSTRRVRVGPSCLNPFTVHPVEIAGQTAMLDSAAKGRAFLGLARGGWLESIGVDQSDPVTAIGEAWEVVRRLLEGDDREFRGRRFSLPQGARLRYPVTRANVPLLIGTWSPRLAALAGEAAQELKVGGSANPKVVPVMRARIGNPAVRIVLGAVTVVDEDAERARTIARREVAMYLAVVAELRLHVPRRVLQAVHAQVLLLLGPHDGDVDLGYLQVRRHLGTGDRHVLDARVLQLEQDRLGGHLADDLGHAGQSMRLHGRAPPTSSS